MEKVPQLTACLLFTFFPAIPCSAYFTFAQPLLQPIDQAMGSLMLCFLFLELFVGYRSLKKLIEEQTAHFFRKCADDDAHTRAAHVDTNTTPEIDENEDRILEKMLTKKNPFQFW